MRKSLAGARFSAPEETSTRSGRVLRLLFVLKVPDIAKARRRPDAIAPYAPNALTEYCGIKPAIVDARVTAYFFAYADLHSRLIKNI